MKISITNNTENDEACQEYFSFKLPSVRLSKPVKMRPNFMVAQTYKIYNIVIVSIISCVNYRCKLVETLSF